MQTRSNNDTIVSNDYEMIIGATGATDHIWAIANTEKARLDSSGLQVNGDLVNGEYLAGAGVNGWALGTPSSTTGNASLISVTSATSLRYHATFRNGATAGNTSGSIVGWISTNSSATAYNTSSDYRLKENITLLDGAIARLNQLPVHRFNFIADPDTVVDGFIAHEAQEVVPECVTGTKDEEDENGDPVYQGIDQSKIVPLLTAALQEAIAKINALEARIAALET